MSKALCVSACAVGILLAAGAPAAARRSGLAAAGARLHRNAHFGNRGAGVLCAGSVRRTCLGFARRRRGFGADLIGYGYGGLTEDPEALRDQGFFADTGDAWVENGHAIYDYDRSYPYDWYPAAPAAAAEARRSAAPPTVRCEISWVGGVRGGHAAVRVCRGRR